MMESNFAFLVIAMTSGQFSCYTTSTLGRDFVALKDSQGVFRTSLGLACMIATFGAILWGFVNLTWWWVVLTYVAVSILLMLPFFYQAYLSIMIIVQPVLDILCISFTLYIWLFLR